MAMENSLFNSDASEIQKPCLVSPDASQQALLYRSLFPAISLMQEGSSLGTIITLLNSRKITLLQARVDHHEVEIADLNRKVKVQNMDIGRLVNLGLELKERLRLTEASYGKLLGVLRVMMMNFYIIKLRLARGKAVREGLWQLNVLKKLPLIRWALLAIVCHGSLHWSQIYNLQSGMSSLLLSPIVPKSLTRRLVGAGNLVLLLTSLFLCNEFYKEACSYFPFNY